MAPSLSTILLGGAFWALPSLAQNSTFVPIASATTSISPPAQPTGSVTDRIANATLFAFPGQNISTVEIQYQPPPIQINGSANYTITFPPVRERVTYFTVGDLAIIDGDVIFGTEAELLAHVVRPGPSKRGDVVDEAPLERRSLSLTRDDPRKWPGGVVQYQWESQTTKTARETSFLAAVKVWTDRLPFLKFEDKGINSVGTLNGPIVLKFSDKSVSSSPVGRSQSAGGNYMLLGSTGNIGVYVHEIGHSMSFPQPSIHVCMHSN